MREVQGGIIGSGLIVAGIGITGLIIPLLKIISPITVAANIGVLGLGLYAAGGKSSEGGCVGFCMQCQNSASLPAHKRVPLKGVGPIRV
jgi:xanthine/uracil permease